MAGVAAFQIGGTTLHSFAGIGSGTNTVDKCIELAQVPVFIPVVYLLVFISSGSNTVDKCIDRASTGTVFTPVVIPVFIPVVIGSGSNTVDKYKELAQEPVIWLGIDRIRIHIRKSIIAYQVSRYFLMFPSDFCAFYFPS